ncbi:brix domain containing protein, putative [Perkinsus marinus ATCC 50983]|uniref:Ribosome production factor 2 homolog n=1 Tax=Perkinsus marinus (strain ATCC 50983 / TXsc) TaxID=423536 RepID=C5KD50_PERM5|nr:brix domain containing protein, putative [Perkinsus marinus ATCC 50983]EER17799.1 brix domain containing protein, putative [Perkinsus marinus ATCC 50983]|eukprot:XP_002786003.1 brix domain containing protein, putative [Perkinsus marinus ATCC 50983]
MSTATTNSIPDDLFKKAKTGKGRRVLAERASKLQENDKTVMLLRGPQAGQDVNALLKDLYDMLKPNAVNLRRNESIQPFEDPGTLEFLAKKNDASLFIFGSKTKKRPFRLAVGRTFDHQLLDMEEMHVSNYVPASQFRAEAPRLGSKPLVIFQGDGFGSVPDLQHARSLLLDVFRGSQAKAVALDGLDHVVVFSAVEDPDEAGSHLICFRHYRMIFKRTGTKLPHVELAELGPRFDLKTDRDKAADHEKWKYATRLPTQTSTTEYNKDKERPNKSKNITTDIMGQRRGRIHLESQNFDKLYTPHHKTFLKRKEKFAETTATDEGGYSPSPKKAKST